MNGVINVYKEKGYTSHDVVARLRGILHQRRIGHTGTLDPDAVGVLPVCVGFATRLCDMLTDETKEYRAVMIIGIETDTQDMTGEIIGKGSADFSGDEIREAAKGFVGTYMQMPPMYSAVKIDGKKLYEYAREGKEVERTEREVTINSIEFTKILHTEYEGQEVIEAELLVECAKGTYIRTLCSDIGKKLGSCGCIKSLERTRVGNYKIEDSVTLEQISKLVEAGRVEEILNPTDSAFQDLIRIQVNEEGDKLLKNGNRFRLRNITPESKKPEVDSEVRVYDANGEFTAIYKYKCKRKEFKPVKMFLGRDE